MQTKYYSLHDVLSGVKQYTVPLFQRPYSWKARNWNELWKDLRETGESSKSRSHFFGAVVTKQEITGLAGVPQHLLIDGQQRLTTSFVLLAALRDEAKRIGDDDLVGDIEQEIIFNHRKKGADYYKLLPTRDDREAFQAVLESRAESGASTHRLAEAARHFRKLLRAVDAPSPRELKDVLLNRFKIVSIQLENEDDPYRIFESLNAKGERLTEADLIRNYFLMRVAGEQQERMYFDLWKPMQDALSDRLSEFMRHFLSKDGELINKGDVYLTVREQADDLKIEGEVENYLRALSHHAEHYARFVEPSREAESTLRAALQRLQKIQVTVAYPFLLHVFEARRRGEIGVSEVAAILETVENFALRRWVCSVPTYGLNKIFPSLWKEALSHVEGDLARLNEGTQIALATKDYPGDARFHGALISAKLYAHGENVRKVATLLERLEISFGHKERPPFDNAQVEHVMPQKLSAAWQNHLGENWEAIHAARLHTLGNLSLTGYNPELSNKAFETKREILRASNYDLNDSIGAQEIWGEDQIATRAEALAQRALKVWPFFGVEGMEHDASTPDGVTGTTPSLLVIDGQEYSVDSWRDVAAKTLEAIYESSPAAWQKITTQFPHYVSASNEGLRSSRELRNGFWMETNLDAKSLYQWAKKSAELVG